MKHNRNHTVRRADIHAGARKTLAFLMLAAFVSMPLMAQDAADESVHTIEVRDGKVWVNGEVVSDLGDDGRRIIFRNGDDGNFITFKDGLPNASAYDHLLDRARVFSDRDSDFHVRSGNFARFFADESEDGGPFMFGFGSDPLIGSIDNAFPSPEVMKLEQEARRLAQRIRQSDGDVSELEDELDATLGRIFDMKMESRAERVEGLESRLQELRDRIDQRETDRGMIIEQRKQELLGRRGRYEW